MLSLCWQYAARMAALQTRTASILAICRQDGGATNTYRQHLGNMPPGWRRYNHVPPASCWKYAARMAALPITFRQHLAGNMPPGWRRYQSRSASILLEICRQDGGVTKHVPPASCWQYAARMAALPITYRQHLAGNMPPGWRRYASGGATQVLTQTEPASKPRPLTRMKKLAAQQWQWKE